MHHYHPFLEITDPQGTVETIKLDRKYPNSVYTIGRYEPNDIKLPEPEEKEKKLITRIDHCILEKEYGVWFIKDRSTNGTILKRGEQEFQLHQLKDRSAQLLDGDIVIIHGWQLRFLDLDPDKTQDKGPPILSPFVFQVSHRALYKMEAGQRAVVSLTPNETKMMTYMASQNLKDNGYPVLCNYEEIKQSIWGNGSESYECESLHNIVKNIRKKLRLVENEDKHKWLETQTGQGYILKIYCEP